MKFNPIPLAGGFLIEIEPRDDERGSFARAFCAKEFSAHGLETTFVQANLSTNAQAGIIRGLHMQCGPDAEVKLVRCVKGSIYDVVVDMRETSATYRRWFGAVLSEDNGLLMYVPKGFAHGYQSLSDEGTTVFYMVSSYYVPGSEQGFRFNDPALAIMWPRIVSGVSDKDAKWPLLRL